MRSRSTRGRRHRHAMLFSAASAVSLGATAAWGQLIQPAQQIAVEGQTVILPDTTILNIETSPTVSMNDSGTIVFFTTLGGPSVTPSGTFQDNHAAWFYKNGALSLAYRRDGAATAFNPPKDVYYGGTTSTAISLFVSTTSIGFDNLDNVLFKADLHGLDVGASNTAVFYGPATNPTALALKTTTVPASAETGGVVAGLRISNFGTRAVGNNGYAAFITDLQNPDLTSNGSALMLGTLASGSNITTLAYGNGSNLGGTLIGADRVYTVGTTGFTLAPDGRAFFQATLNGAGTNGVSALLRGSSSASLEIVARSGSLSPIGGGVNFASFDTTSRSATGPYVGFKAGLTGPGVATSGLSQNSNALFMSGSNGTLVTIARDGTPAPSQPTADYPGPTPTSKATAMLFAGIDNFKLTTTGWGVFSAQLRSNTATSALTTFDGIYLARVDPTSGAADVRKVAGEGDRLTFSQAAIHIERGDFSWALDRWNSIGLDTDYVNSSGQVIFKGGAAEPGGLSSEAEGYYFYDPTLSRVFRLITEGDKLMVDPDGAGPLPAVAKTVSSLTSITSSDGGDGGDGRPRVFNNNRQFVFTPNFTDGTGGLFTLDADDYLPASFHVWNQSAGGSWSAGTNWNGGAPDGATRYAEFSSAISAPATVTLDAAKTVGEIYFKNANKVTLSGAAITLEGVNNVGRIGVGQGDHEIASDLVLADTTSIVTDQFVSEVGATSATSLVLSGAISGTGDLRKGGPGVLRLTNLTNSYTGDTYVRAGYLEVDSTLQLGGASNKVVLDGGILRLLAPAVLPRSFNVTEDVRQTNLFGGIDTGSNVVSLTGTITFNQATNGTGGYVFKYGSGQLIMANSGGVGGMTVSAGSVDVTTPQTWGSSTNIATAGTLFHVAATGSVTNSGNWRADGGAVITLDGPVVSTGQIQASWSNTDGPGLVNINAPSRFSNLVTTARGGTVFASTVMATINVNASTTASGNVTINRTGSNGSEVNVAPGVTLTARQFDIDGILNVPATASLVQTGATNAVDIGSSVPSNRGTLNLFGSHSIAGDLIVGGLLNKPAAYAITVGRDLGVTGGQALSLDAATSAGRDVYVSAATSGTSTLSLVPAGSLTAGGELRVTGSSTHQATMDLAGPVAAGGALANATRGTMNFNGPSAVLTGPVTLDVGTNNRIDNVNFNSGTGSSGGLVLQATTSTSVVTSQAHLTFGAGVTHTTGDITLSAARTSASSTSSAFAPLLNLTVSAGATLNGGNLLIRHDQGGTNITNVATSRVTIAGTANLASVRQVSRIGVGSNIAAVSPSAVGTVQLRVPGRLNIKTGGGTNSTSVLAAVPDFQGTGSLNLGDSALVVDYSGSASASLAQVQAAILSAYVPGTAVAHWTGSGITSSLAEADPGNFAVGYGEASAALGISGTTTATWRGQTVDATSVLVRHTLNGDVDLSGDVGFADLLKVAQNYDTLSGAFWTDGDVTYDGQVGFADLLAVAQHYDQALPGGLPASVPGASDDFNRDWAQALAQVPEPGSAALVAGAMFLLGRRVRRRAR